MSNNNLGKLWSKNRLRLLVRSEEPILRNNNNKRANPHTPKKKKKKKKKTKYKTKQNKKKSNLKNRLVIMYYDIC